MSSAERPAAPAAHAPLSSPWPRRALLLGILALAAVLRFTGLSWGLRHPPHLDERVFVESAERMVAAGDLDHRYYEYPGLFVYLLGLVLPWSAEPGSPDSYRIARGLVAAFGVLSCALLARLGQELAGPRTGLLAALLLAVSPVAVHTAHMVRPDGVLQAFVLLALLALLRVGSHTADDLRAGAALGLATAVKFTGAFLVPCYLLRRALVPGPRGRGLLAAGAAAAIVFLLATPYAVIHARAFLDGVQTQIGHHYEEDGTASGAGPMALAYAGVWVRALGWPGALLALAGAVLVLRREARTWLPLLLLPLLTLAVMSSQRMLLSRFLLPSLGVPAILAAVALERALARRPRLLPVAAVLVAAVPVLASVRYVREVARPGTRDLALDWVRANIPEGTRLVTSVERIGLDPTRLELTRVDRLAAHDRPLLLEMDAAVVTTADDAAALAGLPARARFDSPGAVSGPSILILAVPPSARLAYRPIPFASGALRASENQAEAARAGDGDLVTLWRTEDPQRPGDWLAVALPQEVMLARVEVALGEHGRFAGREIVLSVSSDGQAWSLLPARPARPPVPAQHPQAGPPTQVLVVSPPVPARWVRLGLRRSGAHRWGVAELRLFAPP
jgi:4-amino-4-deoxy-L-arabinose transferase-like glycosyltransferase